MNTDLPTILFIAESDSALVGEVDGLNWPSYRCQPPLHVDKPRQEPCDTSGEIIIREEEGPCQIPDGVNMTSQTEIDFLKAHGQL